MELELDAESAFGNAESTEQGGASSQHEKCDQCYQIFFIFSHLGDFFYMPNED